MTPRAILTLCARTRMHARPASCLFRVYCFITYPHLKEMIAAGIRTGMGDEWVAVGGVKLVCDGSISERTARLSAAVCRAARMTSASW